MKKTNQRIYPSLRHHSYLHLKDLRLAVAKYAPLARGEVIDYGAGGQPYRELFHPSVRYRGADFNVKFPDDIQVTDPRRLPVGDRSADWVVSFQVLEHVADPLNFLQECFRVLRPGGSVLLTTHGTWPYHPGPQNGDYLRWTGEGLANFLSQAGFTSIQVDPVTQGWRALLQQALVMRDPARVKRRPRWRRVFSHAIRLGVNSFAELIEPVCHSHNSQLDVIPTAYIATAVRPTDATGLRSE